MRSINMVSALLAMQAMSLASVRNSREIVVYDDVPLVDGPDIMERERRREQSRRDYAEHLRTQHEAEKPIIEAAEQKRARKNAKRLAARIGGQL